MPKVSTWSGAEHDLLPSLQTSMVYPSKPDIPTTSGWLQMMVTEVSFLSSINRSSGALVGSAGCKHLVKNGTKKIKNGSNEKLMQEGSFFLPVKDSLLDSDSNQKKPQIHKKRMTTLIFSRYLWVVVVEVWVP